jgi:hypothetical protein
MGKYYAVLYGKNATKEFNHISEAVRFAKKKATLRGENVHIDKITVRGDNWSQGRHQVVKPGTKEQAKIYRRQDRNKPSDLFEMPRIKPFKW